VTDSPGRTHALDDLALARIDLAAANGGTGLFGVPPVDGAVPPPGLRGLAGPVAP
jgi:hypothetical protein